MLQNSEFFDEYEKNILAVAMASAMVSDAQTAEGQGHGKITFKGSALDAACSIDSKSLDLTVELGSIARPDRGRILAYEMSGYSYTVNSSTGSYRV